MSFSAFALPSGGVAAAPPRPGTLRRRPSRRCSRARAGSDASDASPDDSGDFSLRALARRVEQIKRDEARGTTTMPVIVLDATLPGQRLGLRFDKKDTRRALNAGTALGPLAEVGDVFAMLGQAPRSGQVLPFGVEVAVSAVRDFPDGSGDVEVELVGKRRVRIEGQPFDENGVAMARVAFMDFAPDAPTSAAEDDFSDDESVLRGEHDAVKGAHPAATTRSTKTDDSDSTRQEEENARAAAALAPLVSEWKTLVREGGHERRKGQLELIESHIGPMPPSGEPARVAAWVAALINPIPALGVAYEIRPALLMAAGHERHAARRERRHRHQHRATPAARREAGKRRDERVV